MEGTFPVEIWENVVYSIPPTAVRDLRNLYATSMMFRDLVEPVLYHSLVLKQPGPAFWNFKGTLATYYDGLLHYLSRLENTTRIRNTVHSLELFGWTENPPEMWEGKSVSRDIVLAHVRAAEAIFRLLATGFANLDCITLTGSLSPAMFIAVVRLGKLDTLRFNRCTLENPTRTNLDKFNRQLVVRKLHLGLWVAQVPPSGSLMFPADLSRVEDLQLASDLSSSGSFLAILAQPLTYGLRSLTLSVGFLTSDIPRCIPAMLTRSPNLESLAFYGWKPNFEALITAVSECLAKPGALENLKKLRGVDPLIAERAFPKRGITTASFMEIGQPKRLVPFQPFPPPIEPPSPTAAEQISGAMNALKDATAPLTSLGLNVHELKNEYLLTVGEACPALTGLTVLYRVDPTEDEFEGLPFEWNFEHLETLSLRRNSSDYTELEHLPHANWVFEPLIMAWGLSMPALKRVLIGLQAGVAGWIRDEHDVWRMASDAELRKMLDGESSRNASRSYGVS